MAAADADWVIVAGPAMVCVPCPRVRANVEASLERNKRYPSLTTDQRHHWALPAPHQAPGVKLAIAFATSSKRIDTDAVAWSMFTYFTRAERTSPTPAWNPTLITNAVSRNSWNPATHPAHP